MSRIRKFDYQMLYLVFIAVCFWIFIISLAFYMDDREEKCLQNLESSYNVDSLRSSHQKFLQLNTLEDSIHEFEDGF